MFATIILRDLRQPVRARHVRHVGPYQWSPADPHQGRGWYADAAGGTDSRDSTFRLRVEPANEHLHGYRLTDTDGYFTDPDGDGDTLQPVIFRLPRSRGFLAGWTMGAQMCGALDREIYPDAEDAAHAAHSMADHDAEDMRERVEQMQAELDATDNGEDN